MRHPSLLLLTTAAVTASLASPCSAVVFNEVARFGVGFAFRSDLDTEDEIIDDNPKYIGTNPLGVAWDGSKLYLAGFDNAGSSFLPIGLIEVLDATRTGTNILTDADFSNAFGQIYQPPGRGYTGIALSGGLLAASYDDGSATQNGIQVFDTTDNSLVWDIGTANAGATARGGSGVAFDPGYQGDPAQGGGVAWTTFGSGRRAMQDAATGVTQYNLTNGFRWLTEGAFESNFARDIAFDPETGDAYVRRSNDIDAAKRTGANSTSDLVTIVDGVEGPFQLGHKIEFIGGTAEGDLLIYNDRPAGVTPPAFVDAIKVVDTSGVPIAATYNLLGGGTGADIGDGAAIYDFDYDVATGTLAILDFSNRNVFIFEIAEEGGLLTGDYNRDGKVDAADYTIWRDSLDTSVGNPFDGADGNGDGFVDDADYAPWADNYGATATTPSTSVPEPAGVLLAAIGLSALRVSRRR